MTPASFMLTPTEVTKHGELGTQVGRALNSLLDAIDEANKVAEVQLRAIHDAAAVFNSRMNDLLEFTSATAAPMRQVFNSQPQQWRDSPEGEAVASFISEWEAFSPLPWEPKSPGEIQAPDDGDLNQFSTLPTVP